MLIGLSFASYGQVTPLTASVSVRIHNNGRFYIKQYSIIIGKEKYSFEDIPKGKYSDFKKLPYLYSTNWTEVQVIRKRFLQYDEWIKQIAIPIDHTGDKKIETGATTIEVSTKRKHRSLEIESEVK